MKAILKKFKINEKLTKPRLIQKQFNSVRTNVPMIEDYNFMADLLHLPETKEGYKYLLVVVDLATKEFDIEPMKDTNSNSTVNAMQTMFKTRNHLKQPYASIQVDGGAEFNKVFKQWCRSNNILLKRTMPYRHQQNSMVESLNRQLGRLFNGYMNRIEQETGETYREWTDILDDVREEMNKFRKEKMPENVSDYDYPFFDQTHISRFKVGDWVHYRLDYPEDALGKKQPTPDFRAGDFRYSHEPHKIVKIIHMNSYPYYRYMIFGLPNVSYSEYDLLKTNYNKTKLKSLENEFKKMKKLDLPSTTLEDSKESLQIRKRGRPPLKTKKEEKQQPTITKNNVAVRRSERLANKNKVQDL